MPRPLPWPVTETDASLSARLSGAVVWSSRLTRWQQSPCDKAEAARTYYLLNHSATARRTEIRTRNEDVRVIRRVTARRTVPMEDGAAQGARTDANSASGGRRKRKYASRHVGPQDETKYSTEQARLRFAPPWVASDAGRANSRFMAQLTPSNAGRLFHKASP